MVEVSALQGSHAGNQCSQGPRKRVGNEKHQPAPDQDSCEAQQEQQPVQVGGELGCLIVGSENGQANWRGLPARQFENRGEEMLVAYFDIAGLTAAGSSQQALHATALHLLRSQSCGHDIAAVRECDLASGNLADFTSQTVVDGIALDAADVRRLWSRNKSVG